MSLQGQNPIPIRIRLPYSTDEEFVEKYGTNVARGGIFIATRALKPEGTLLQFELVLSDGARLMRGEGVVAKAQVDDGGARAGMTLRFTRLDAASKALVDRVVARRSGVHDVRLLVRTPTLEFVAPVVPEAAEAAGAPEPASDPTDPAPATVAKVEPQGIGQEEPEVTDPGRRRRRLALDTFEAPAAANTVVPAEELVLGIDLGTSHCRVAVFVGGEPRLVPLSPDGKGQGMPSAIALDEQDRFFVGARARAQLLIDPENAVASAWSRLDRHGPVAVELRGRPHPLPELLSHLMTTLREAAQAWAGKPISRAVLSVPAAFDDRQRAALLQAGRLAGLEVLRIVNAPSAAALAFGFGRGLARKRVLVYDLGGGSFEASLLEITGDDLDVVGTASAALLGGAEFDRRIADELGRLLEAELKVAPGASPHGMQRILDAAEQTKIQLSELESTEVHVPFATAREDGTPVDFRSTLTRETLERLTSDLVDRTVETTRAVLAAANLTPQSLDEVLLVGGQSRTPLVRRKLEEALGRPARSEPDPQGAVARGAAILGHSILRQEEGKSGARISDLLTVPVGVGVRGGGLLRVLERQTRLPVRKSLAFPIKAGESLTLAVFQGEGPRVEDCALLGVARVQGDRDGEAVLQLRVTVDGTLELSARAPGSRADVVAEASEATGSLESLLVDAPQSNESDDPATQRGLLGGIRRLFGRR